ncbi:CAP domain-containing protein [Anaerocolumna sp. MB42-C2]|uniref:CAP domain-containing protein n=1 Tax=Anaerocolumna sp. MB42-C2 TaxID=3070997 RepID=UPI0027E0BE3A|nr:CAP domain-containing protein [Anaerocolumna sp. MB42-C2]WMJ85974.1 CAP domain-containing protein [Anaerocolumna sp. MB42-C2]
MKKLLVTSMVTLTLVSSTLFGGNLNPFDVNNTAVAAAATTKSFKNCKPTVSVKSTTATTANLNIGKVSGADSYKVYRATSPNGSYKCVGTTKSNCFKDSGLKANKTYYYKVKACDKVNGKTLGSQLSNQVKATPCKNGSKTTIIYSGSNGADINEIIKKALNGNENTSTPTKTATPSKTPVKTPTQTTTPASTNNYDSSFAGQVLKLVNEERAKGGLSALTMSQNLVAPANKRAQEIVQQFSHTRPNGTQWSTVLDEYNVSVSAAGENLAYGYNTPEAVVEGWMNSPGHRANIMNGKFHKIGIGVYKNNGTVYCTQLFSN